MTPTLKGLRLGTLLWQAQILSFLNQTVRSRRPGPLIGLAAGVLILLVLWVQEGLGAAFGFAALRGLSPGYRLDPILSAIFAGYTVFLLFSATVFTLNALLLHSDLDLLVAAPWPPEAVIAAKVLSQLLTLFGGTLLLILPGLVVGPFALGHPAAIVPLVAVVAVYPALPVMGVTALLLTIVRFVPPERAREAITALSLLVAFGVSAANFLLSPALRRAAGSSPSLPPPQLAESPWFPFAWAGRAAGAALAGNWAETLLWGGLLMLVAAAVFSVGAGIGGRLYVSGWVMGTAPHRRRIARRRRSRGVPGLGLAVAALVAKDWRLRRRDMALLVQLVAPAAFLMAFGLLRARSLLGLLSTLPAGPVRALGALSPALFLLMLVSQPLSVNAVSLEGKALWIWRASPTSAGRLLEAKCWAAALPTAAIGLAGGVVLEALARPGWAWAAGAIVILVIVAIGMSVVLVAIGALWPRFDWTDARRMVHPVTSILSLLAELVLLGGTGLVLAGFLLIAWLFHLPVAILWLVGILASATLVAGLAAGAMVAAAERLGRLEVA